jgi:hypothetical protein
MHTDANISSIQANLVVARKLVTKSLTHPGGKKGQVLISAGKGRVVWGDLGGGGGGVEVGAKSLFFVGAGFSYATIQAAVDAAEAYGNVSAVIVTKGVYREKVITISAPGVSVFGWGARESISITGSLFLNARSGTNSLQNVTVNGSVEVSGVGTCVLRGVHILQSHGGVAMLHKANGPLLIEDCFIRCNHGSAFYQGKDSTGDVRIIRCSLWNDNGSYTVELNSARASSYIHQCVIDNTAAGVDGPGALYVSNGGLCQVTSSTLGSVGGSGNVMYMGEDGILSCGHLMLPRNTKCVGGIVEAIATEFDT